MSLYERIHANRCAVDDCDRERAADSDVCTADLNEKWANRLDRNADGRTYRRRRTFVAADLTSQIRSAA